MSLRIALIVFNNDALPYSVDNGFLTGMRHQKTAMDPTSSLDSVSSTNQVKQGSISSHLREIAPANRSSLTSDKLLKVSILKCSSDLTRTGKESFSGKRSIQDFDDEAGDLVAPGILKKHKLLITGPDQSKHCEKSYHFSNLVNNESLWSPENVCNQNPQEKEALVDVEIITENETVEHNIGKHKDVASQTVPHNNDETKGSAFLVQVTYL